VQGTSLRTHILNEALNRGQWDCWGPAEYHMIVSLCFNKHCH
jgi:hypothetical protein